MKIFSTGFYNGIQHNTHNLMRRMLNPLCGMVQQIGFVHRGSNEPRSFIAGADLCGVHVLQGRNAPRRGAYHIGGGGVLADEAFIKSLGEAIERYAQLMPDIEKRLTIEFKTYQEMKNEGKNVLDASYLNFYSEQQFARKGFPFQPFNENIPFSWISVNSIYNNFNSLYIPMQLLFVGYAYKKSEGEHWLASAVTTGTAAHITHEKAIKSAILELIQLDATMGHWYTNTKSLRINFDVRTAPLQRLLKKFSSNQAISPQFYWIKSCDLKGFVIACLFEKKVIPHYAVGLGADTDLLKAMYKAYLEALGVLQLAKIVLISEKYSGEQYETSADAMYDLDSNIALYAKGDYAKRIAENFLCSKSINASELPANLEGNDQEQLAELIDSFKKTNKDLYYIDITNQEAHDLGIKVARVWSPQLLGLAIPSAVPSRHQRFLDYGEITHEDPHPYP